MFRILLREYERFIGFSRTIHVREIRLSYRSVIQAYCKDKPMAVKMTSYGRYPIYRS